MDKRKPQKGDIFEGTDPYTKKKVRYKYAGKETSEMLVNSGFKFRFKSLNKKDYGSKIIVTKQWIKERSLKLWQGKD